MRYHNAEKTCWNCPAMELKGIVDFRACGQSMRRYLQETEFQPMIRCKRRPELGMFDPFSVTFEECPEWVPGPYGYMLRDMRVMILGIDGYLGWTLALWLGSLGFKVSGVDNFSRRRWVKEKGSDSVVPIAPMSERLRAAKEVLGIEINFREMDILERDKLREFIEETQPEAIVHYGECPSAPYSMVDAEHAAFVQMNNVIGTLGLLFIMRDVVPETSLVKLGTLGEYGAPLTGRPLFEGIFPADAVLLWDEREWSLGGELTPRDPVSFYHVCYDEETEVFTRDGWKRFRELSYEDEILTWDLEKNCVKYEKPVEIMAYDYEGKMYRVKHRKVDLKVTPNHRMVVGNKTREGGIKWKILLAEEIKSLTKFYKVSIPNWEGEERETFTLPGVKVATTRKKGEYYFRNVGPRDLPMDDWLRFFAWFIAEGYVYKYKQSISKYKIQIAQDASSEEELQELIELIKRLGFKPHINRAYGKIKGISIYDSQLGQYLERFGKSNEKYIPRELKELSKRQLRILFETLIKGNGSKIGTEHKKQWAYYTASKRLADDVQEIALKLGYSAILREGKTRRNYPEYALSISTTVDTQVNLLHDNDEWVSYKGKVYCCQVSTGTLLVRRNGRPVWSGNSKVQDTFNIYEACKYWWLRSYDIMQGVIYGVHTDQVAADPRLRTRFDIDEWFGTVINRFVAQAIIGLPLTIYGSGNQARGFIAIRDAMECMTRLIVSPPEPGQYDVVNQVTGVYRIRDLAHTVARVGAEEFGLTVRIQHLENPRVEADEHPYEVVYEKLPNTFGFEPKVPLEEEVHRMFRLLMQPHIRQRIEKYCHTIIPKTRWSGLKKEAEVLETYTYEPTFRMPVPEYPVVLHWVGREVEEVAANPHPVDPPDDEGKEEQEK